MESNFHMEIAKEEDIPKLAVLWTRAFAAQKHNILMGLIDTPEALAAAGTYHQRAWREHVAETGIPPVVKCIYTDPQTGEQHLAAAAYWYIFYQPRSPENAKKWNYMNSAAWLSNEEDRKIANEAFRPVVEMYMKWTAGRGHGLLKFMVTDERFRRQGAAGLIMQWGVDRCKELGIPAYLEAFWTSKPVYERFGFEQIDIIETEADGVKLDLPAMMWWPPETKAEEKVPLDS